MLRMNALPSAHSLGFHGTRVEHQSLFGSNSQLPMEIVSKLDCHQRTKSGIPCIRKEQENGVKMGVLMPRATSLRSGRFFSLSKALADGHVENQIQVDSLLDKMKWDKNGLVVAIAQHVDTGAILMQGFANREAVAATISSLRATFYSRSRSSLWTKGETSSNFIHVLDIYLDCDRDSIIYLGKPDGPTCHTGAETCYYTSVLQDGALKQITTTLYGLENIIAQRKAEEPVAGGKPSWTKRLQQDPKLLCSKIREEASELCQTLEASEGRDRTVSEMADVLYHSMVLLSVQEIKLEEVMATLRKRFSQSGVEEKANRVLKPPVTSTEMQHQ